MITFLVNYAKKSHEKAFTAFRVKALGGKFHSSVFMPTYLRMGKDLVADESDIAMAVYVNQVRIEANRLLAKRSKVFSWTALIASFSLAFLAVPLLWSVHEPSRPLSHTIQLLGAHKAISVLPEGPMKEKARAMAEKLEDRLAQDLEERQKPAEEAKGAVRGAFSTVEGAVGNKIEKIKSTRESKKLQTQKEFEEYKKSLGSF